MTTRAEHMEWCKQRAHEYCDRNDAKNAMASMLSDLEKHPETAGHIGSQVAIMLMLGGDLGDTKNARKFIDGFN